MWTGVGDEAALGCGRGAADGRIWMRSSLLLLAVDNEGGQDARVMEWRCISGGVHPTQSGEPCCDQLRQWPWQLLPNLEGRDACALVERGIEERSMGIVHVAREAREMCALVLCTRGLMGSAMNCACLIPIRYSYLSG